MLCSLFIRIRLEISFIYIKYVTTVLGSLKAIIEDKLIEKIARFYLTTTKKKVAGIDFKFKLNFH